MSSTTVASLNNVTVAQPDACSDPGPEVPVARTAGESLELSGERNPITLGNPAAETHVLTRAVDIAVDCCLAGQTQ